MNFTSFGNDTTLRLWNLNFITASSRSAKHKFKIDVETSPWQSNYTFNFALYTSQPILQELLGETRIAFQKVNMTNRKILVIPRNKLVHRTQTPANSVCEIRVIHVKLYSGGSLKCLVAHGAWNPCYVININLYTEYIQAVSILKQK